jgi:hypothetical protein
LKLATHPSSTKMYRDLKSFYWWLKIKKEIAEFMAKYAVNQQVKIEHQKLTSGLQPFSISKWKWEDIRILWRDYRRVKGEWRNVGDCR